MHTNKKHFKCNDCNYVASEHRKVKQHDTSVLKKGKRIQCNEWDYAASPKSHLRQHLISVHCKQKKSTANATIAIMLHR